MEMCRESSAKRGFKKNYKKVDFTIPEETLQKILIVEEELRFSQEAQDMYTACGDDVDKINQVSISLQRRALAACGITDPRGLDVLHNIRVDYEFEDWLDTAVYIRTDKFLGIHDLSTGQPIPNYPQAFPTKVHHLDGTSVVLKSYIDSCLQGTDKYMVLISGSAS
eukprot:TRINITY_DN11965_c0_g1_i1.p2 TRINITY_DN11965_c0_g1~~TRINITY_DN11965_c0_g1_i1.p2  ORF type:complete len:166 (-),score=19.86 TRINITY_DN11965_c0_g1_i1:627-1124(-)